MRASLSVSTDSEREPLCALAKSTRVPESAREPESDNAREPASARTPKSA